MLLVILDILSYLTVGILTIPAWISFFLQSLADFGDMFAVE